METVEQHMTNIPATVGLEETVANALRTMRRMEIRHLPVVEDGRLVGVLSERELQLVSTLPILNPTTTSVEVAMSKNPQTIAPDAPLKDAALRMADTKVGSLVVVKDGDIVGILTTTDALLALARIL